MHDAVWQVVPLDSTIYKDRMSELSCSKIVNYKAPRVICNVFEYYTMRQKFSNFFNPFFFMIEYANAFDMCFIGRVLHSVTFRDNFVCFSYVHGLPRGVDKIMQITCPAIHVHSISSKFALTDSYM